MLNGITLATLTCDADGPAWGNRHGHAEELPSRDKSPEGPRNVRKANAARAGNAEPQLAATPGASRTGTDSPCEGVNPYHAAVNEGK